METRVVTRAGEVRPYLRSWGSTLLHTSERAGSVAQQANLHRIALIVFGLTLASIFPYVPFLSLPLISDDYIQLMLGRRYGPSEGWTNLASDVLYRSRATSILVTHWTDELLGPVAWAHRSVNVLFHAANVLLIAMCGFWPRIGWRISISTAAAFALLELHQEAVIWSAALPELMVFTFGLGSLMAWVKWLNGGHWAWAGVSVASFGLALLSKESGVVVVPLAGLLWLLEARSRWLPLGALAFMGVVSTFYAYGIFTASADHLHLNDGTFSIRAPFWKTLAISMLRMMWPWGVVSLAALWFGGMRKHYGLLLMASVWVVVTLLPYSFLTYMDRVPSRHTYWASMGLAVLVACAWVSLSRWNAAAARGWALAFAIVFVLGNLGYLWTKKLDQFERRAQPTEHFLRFAAESDQSIRVACSPYGFEAYQQAAVIRMGKPLEFVSGPHQPDLDRRNYCDRSKP